MNTRNRVLMGLFSATLLGVSLLQSSTVHAGTWGVKGQATSASLGDSSVTTAKLGDGSVTTSKLGQSLIIDATSLRASTITVHENVVFEGQGRIKLDIQFGSEMFVAVSAFKTVVQHLPALRFDASAVEQANLSFEVPHGIDLTIDPKIKLKYAMQNNQSVGSDVVINTSFTYLNVGDTLDADFASENHVTTVTVPNVGKEFAELEFFLDGSLMEDGNIISVRISRNATSAADDRNGDWDLIFFEFYYAVNRIGKNVEDPL